MANEINGLADYILDARPEPGDEFVVRVLDGNNDPSKAEPWHRIYIRRADRGCVTMDFRIDWESEERVS